MLSWKTLEISLQILRPTKVGGRVGQERLHGGRRWFHETPFIAYGLAGRELFQEAQRITKVLKAHTSEKPRFGLCFGKPSCASCDCVVRRDREAPGSRCAVKSELPPKDGQQPRSARGRYAQALNQGIGAGRSCLRDQNAGRHGPHMLVDV